MDAPLWGGILGLALLDSLNPATIVGVALILLTVPHAPVRSASAFILGAFLTVLGVGTGIFLGLGATLGATADGLEWLRRGAFLIASVALLVAGLRRLRDRERTTVALPSWFGGLAALPFGVLVTALDLPNAFPYVVAIERMIHAGVEPAGGLVVLAVYALIYCLPCLGLLVLGLTHGPMVRSRLQAVTRKLGSGTVRRSVPAAVSLVAGAAGVFFFLVLN